ncbi:MAG TPA: sigma-70 family RNA polymerase sigma factor [Gemmataceae bacterium]|nr:sigma-70 family RNA polymerase sigma factor [Gemmataceae bacterium]
MNQSLLRTAVERAGRLAAPLALDDLSDADLLARYLSARDEPAFAAIVRRHGPLVWGVCRGLSASEADAEDAFQATFLALFRAASKVRQPNALGAWLHRVAGRVCRNGLRAKARRAKRERLAAKAEASQPTTEAAWDRWQAAVHAEIDRLPDQLRVPFVLCVLQGVRQNEAAKRLGWKLGTVSGRVCLAKQALTRAIGRRGLTGPAVIAALAGGGMWATPVTASLVARGSVVVQSAMGTIVSTTVRELARGAMGGTMSKMKLFAGIVLAGAMTIGAVGSRYPGTAEAQPPAGGGPLGPGPGIGAGAPGVPGLPPGPPSGLAPGKGPTGGGGGGVMGFGSSSPGKIEYQFKPKPSSDNGDKFKSLLAQLGNDGWEYIGLVPGSDELIFKRAQRPAMGGGMMSGFGGMGLGGAGMPGMPAPGGFGGGGGSGSAGSLPKAGSGGTGRPGAAGPSGLPGPGGFPGSPPPGGGFPGFPGGGGGDGPPVTDEAPTKPVDTVELKVGETIRHHMNNYKVIERLFTKDGKVAEVSADPTDAHRVLIKALAAGSTQLDLTDALGNKEKFTVRVK